MARLEIPLHTTEAPFLKRGGVSVYVVACVLFVLCSMALARFWAYKDTTSPYAPADTQAVFHGYFLRPSISANHAWLNSVQPITGSTATFGDIFSDIKKEYSWFISESGNSLCIRSWDGLSDEKLEMFGLNQTKISNKLFLLSAGDNQKTITEEPLIFKAAPASIISLLSFKAPLIGQLGFVNQNATNLKMQPIFANDSTLTISIPPVSLNAFPRSFVSLNTNLAIGFPSEQNELWNLLIPNLLPESYAGFLPPNGIVQDEINQKNTTLMWWQNTDLKAKKVLPLMLAAQNPETVIQKTDEGGEYEELRLFPERVTLTDKSIADNNRFQATYSKNNVPSLFADESIQEGLWFAVSDNSTMLDRIHNDPTPINNPILAYAKCDVLLKMIKQNPFSSPGSLEEFFNTCKNITLLPAKNATKIILEK